MPIDIPIIQEGSEGFATKEALQTIAVAVEEIKEAPAITEETDPLWNSDKPLYDAHINNSDIHVSAQQVSQIETVPEIVEGTTELSTSFSNHVSTDRFRWADSYTTQLELYEQIASSQGLKPDFDNATTVPQGTPYSVSAPQGGLLTVRAMNENGFFTTVAIVGKASWNSDGLIEGVPITKYFRMVNGDTVQIDNAQSVTFTPAIEDLENPTRNTLENMQGAIDDNKQALLNINARLSNKKPSGEMTNIESASQGEGYTVPANSSLGGRVHGLGVNALLGSTGVVTVTNDQGTIEIYNNLGLLSLLAPVPVLVEDVMDGDVVKSSGMAELFYEPYVTA